MFFLYILLNMTVSMVKGFYDQNMRIKTESAYQVMAQLTFDAENKVDATKAERQCSKPTEMDFKEDSASFKACVVPKTLCRQYVIVASTEVEECAVTVDPYSVAVDKLT